MKPAFLIIMVFALIISGCKTENVASKEKTNTVEYYIHNKEERKEKIQECNNNPGEMENLPNCKNAKKAALIDIGGDPSKLRF
jgi:hypothetical protein